MNTQPNFEKIKTSFYRLFVDSSIANMAILRQALSGKLLPSFSSRENEFRKDLHNWLNRVDIRQAGMLIDIINENGGKLPVWLREKKFAIDYNNHNALDLYNTQQ